MKYLILIIFILLVNITLGQNPKAKIILDLKNSPKQSLKILLVKKDGNYFLLDSIQLGSKSEEKIEFDVPVNNIEQEVNLFFSVKSSIFVNPVMLPGETLTITSDFNGPKHNTVMTGSVRTLELYNYLKLGNDLSKLFKNKKDAYLNAAANNDPDSTKLKFQMDSVNKIRLDFEKNEAFKTNSAAIAEISIVGAPIYGFTYSKAEIGALKKKFYYYQGLIKDLDVLEKNEANNFGSSTIKLNTRFGNIQLPDSTDTQVSLNKFKGKYILVDFWASWCSPCRMEMPYLKAAYKRFQHKNFVIISISIDKNHESWKKAIQADTTGNFVQLIDDKGWQSNSILRYHISSIPSNFLLNPKGVIIAKDLREDQLMLKLSSVFKNGDHIKHKTN